MASVSLFLDTRRQLKNGKFPLNFRVSHLNQTRLIRLQYELESDEWNEPKKEIRKLENYRSINLELQKQLSKLKSFLIQEDHLILRYSITELSEKLKATLAGKPNYSGDTHIWTLREFSDIIISRTMMAGKYKTAQWYKQAVHEFLKYTGTKDIPMIEIDVTLLHNFTAHGLGRKLSKNSIGGRLRAIRAILNKARREGEKYLPNNHKPFENFSIPSQKTPKRAISKESLQKIRDFAMTDDDPQWHYRNFFLFMFNMRGMNFVDLAKLKVGQVHEGRLQYTRSKTGKYFDLKITQEAWEILEDYLCFKKADDYIFPIIPIHIPDEPNAISKASEDALSVFNKNLKKLAKRIGLEEKLTSYVARHSWATAARKLGVSIDLISESLGHSDLRVTEIYLQGFENEVLDQLNEQVTK